MAAKSPRHRLAGAAFAGTLGLAAVLVVLILAEILEVEGLVLGARARQVGLRVAVPGLVVMLVGVVPAVEVWSVLASRGWRFGVVTVQGRGKGRNRKGVNRTAWGLLVGVWLAWLAGS